MLGYLLYALVAGATLILVFLRGVYWVFEMVAILGSRFVFIHEACHKVVAYLLGVGVEDRGVVETDSGSRYRLEYADDATPRDVLLINLAPLLLAFPSLFGYYLFWDISGIASWLALPFSFVLGMMSLPSIDDFLAILFHNSLSQPFSSLVSTLVAIPACLVLSPAIYLEDASFAFWIVWSLLLAVVTSPYRSLLTSHAVSLVRFLSTLLPVL